MRKNEEQPHTLTDLMAMAPRCGAKTRAGSSCRAPAVKGRKRCRLHGGAKGSGAPYGNQNAYKHGFYSEKMRLARKMIRGLIMKCCNDIVS